MLLIILREILIFTVSLAVFPVIALVLLLYTDSLGLGLSVFFHRLDLGTSGPGGISYELWIRLIAPYALVQAIRAYRWAQRSEKGRRWSNLYYAVILSVVGAYSLSEAWDLFHFMYVLGDIPGEITQFVEIEGVNLAISVVSFFLGFYCLGIFFARGPKQPLQQDDNHLSG